MIPLKAFFEDDYTWNAVYHHYRKWCADDSWRTVFVHLLIEYKTCFDMSSIEFDGSHTPAKRGGEAVGYQGRKKSKTSNLLILTDKNGVPLSCSDPKAGQHNDAHELIAAIKELKSILDDAGITIEGCALNADAGFDTKEFREYCFSKDILANIDVNQRNGMEHDYYFDELLYNERFAVERTNAWMDGFKAVMTRFEIKKTHWKALNLLAFIVIILRKFGQL